MAPIEPADYTRGDVNVKEFAWKMPGLGWLGADLDPIWPRFRG